MCYAHRGSNYISSTLGTNSEDNLKGSTAVQCGGIHLESF